MIQSAFTTLRHPTLSLLAADPLTENPPEPDPAWQARFAAAEQLFESGAFSAAETAYRDVIEAAPSHLPAYVGAARAARQQHDFQAALAYSQASIPMAPDNPWPQLEAAADLRSLGRFDEAEQAYHAVNTITPGNFHAYLGLALCARQRGDLTASLENFKAAAAADPANIWARLELAADQLQSGQPDAARITYREVLALEPGNFHAHLGLAQCARQTGDRLASFTHFSAAAMADPANHWPRLEAAADLLELGQLDAAEDGYRQILALMPGDFHAHLGLAGCARQRGDRPLSLQHFQAAAQANPENIWARLEAAADLLELGQPAAADTAYAEILTLEPGNMHAHLGRGQCARRQGNLPAALTHFAAAATASPTHLWPRLESASTHLDLDQFDAAETIYRAMLQTDGEIAIAHIGLGHGARRRGDHLAAFTHFQAAEAAEPGHTGARLEIATDLRELGRLDEAATLCRAILADHPDHLATMLCLGLINRQAGAHEAALAVFTQAAASAPENAGILVEMAVQQHILGRQKDCDALLQQALARDPKNVWAIMCAGDYALIAGDGERAYAIYHAATQDQPEEIQFHLGLAEALLALGRMEEALASLAALEDERGFISYIRSKRVNLLRQAGQYHQVIGLARAGTAAAPHDAQLWAERFLCELIIGSDSEIETCLAAMPPGNARHQARGLRFRGNLLESRWQIAEAITQYEAATAIFAEEAEAWKDIVRAGIILLDMEKSRHALRKFCTLTADVTRARNRPMNISQTLYGQIIDDDSLDQPVLEHLQQTLALPPPERMPALRRAVRDNPDSSAAAVSLMVALAQAGIFARPVPGTGGAIPSTITQFWDTDPPPDDVSGLMQSWAKQNPGFGIKIFSDRTAREYLVAKYPPAVLQAYLRTREPAQKADVFRLAWLVAEGGIYADADDRCIAPITTLIPPGAELMLYQEDHGTIANNFIAATPNHPLLRNILTQAVNAINRGDSDIVWLCTGPGLFTRCFAQSFINLAQPPALPPGMVVLQRRALFQAVAIHCGLGYKRTDQHWSNKSFASGARRRPAMPVT